MAVYYKFKSAKDFDSIAIDGHFISVGMLKEKIFESKHLGRGTDFDIVVTNAQTNEEYLDEAMLIPKNTSVLIRRVPGQRRMRILTQEEDEPKIETKVEDPVPAKSIHTGADSTTMKYPEEEWDEFGTDLYALPEVLPVQSNNLVQDAALPNKEDEDSKIKALIDTPALDWQHGQGNDGFGGPGRGFGRGMGGRMMGGRGFGRVGFEKKTPPSGYVCHRCKVPGHFIQHCPTNGDPNYDVKRAKPPTGIPRSMLMATSDGSYALPSGAVAVLKPNEAAFEKEIEGIPSTRSVGDLPPELYCPLCKEVMKDAVLTSKCCFRSFCDKCIRDYIITKSMCICGATYILADDLLPNKTLRDTINRILESNNSSAENAGSTFQVQDMESSRPQPKIPSPTLSAASKGVQQPPPPHNEEFSKLKGAADERNVVVAPQQISEKGKAAKIADFSEVTLDSISVKEAASHGSAPQAEEGAQQKVTGEAGKKKKKKKARLPMDDMQWKASQGLVAENYMMPPMGPAAYDPYWNGMQPGMEAYAPPFAGAMPYSMGYGIGPFDMPFMGCLPQDPFAGQGYMLPPVMPPQRDLADFGMGFNGGPLPTMSREEFEARKADLRRKREMERRGGRDVTRDREFPKDREFAREVQTSGDGSSMRPKHRSSPQPSTANDQLNRHRPERRSLERRSVERSYARDPEPRPPKRKSSEDRHQRHHSESTSAKQPPPHISSTSEKQKSSKLTTSVTTTTMESSKHKRSVFSRISFPEGGEKEEMPNKKRKVTSDGATGGVNESSDEEDRHFKRRPSRYDPSPTSERDGDEARSSKSRDRDRERGYGKHR